MKKKLLACFLCAVMAVTMAVPAFAADDAGGIPPTWPDYGMANQYRNTTHCRLNVYISDPSKITNGTNAYLGTSKVVYRLLCLETCCKYRG